MPDKTVHAADTVGLSTKVEEDFIAPLTAVRGALEIMRDFDDLTDAERRGFVERALNACKRLEEGVDHLSSVVYAAALNSSGSSVEDLGAAEYTGRIYVHHDHQIIEIDFSDYEFRNSEMVNAFYDVIDRVIENEGGQWYVALNQRNCRVWPEAWIAFAHRGKRVRVVDALAVVRFAEAIEGVDPTPIRQDLDDPMFFDSRADAFKTIEQLRAST